MNERDRNRAIVVLDLLGEEITDEAINDWLASGDQPYIFRCNKCNAPTSREYARTHEGLCKACFEEVQKERFGDRLPCGCEGECDPYAHDTHPDGPGKPAGPAFDDLTPEGQREYLENHEWERCAQCGNRCPEGDEICGQCASANRELEDAINEDERPFLGDL